MSRSSSSRFGLGSAFVRYLSVGTLATAVHYAVLICLVEWGAVPAGWAAALGAWVGAQVAYVGNTYYTFAGSRLRVAAWLRFQTTACIGAVLSLLIVSIGVSWHLYYLAAQVVATVAAVFVTYEINRRWAFSGPGHAPRSARE